MTRIKHQLVYGLMHLGRREKDQGRGRRKGKGLKWRGERGRRDRREGKRVELKEGRYDERLEWERKVGEKKM